MCVCVCGCFGSVIHLTRQEAALMTAAVAAAAAQRLAEEAALL